MKILIFCNSGWNISNFRIALVKKLKLKYDVYSLSQRDKYTKSFKKEFKRNFYVDINSRSVNIFNEFFKIIHIIKIIKNLRPDLLLNFSHKPIIYGSLSSLFFNTKVINVVTGIGHAFSNKKYFIQAILIFFYRILEYSYEKIVFQNRVDLQYFLKKKYLLNKRKSTIIRGSGVNVKNFALKNSLSNNKKIFTFVGRILPEKGIVEFIKAAKHLKRRNNSLNFRVVGSLNKKYLSKEFLNFFHKSLKMNDFIFINNSRNIKKEYKKTDCVVLPSYREGLSRTLLEAASMNKFIVTTKAPGCSDIIINNYNGFTCQTRNTNMLIKTLEKFLRLSKPTISRMSKRSRKIVLDKFQDDIIIKQYLNLINKVILRN